MNQVASIKPSEWVDRHADALYRYALTRVRGAQLAEDLVQETFLAALQNRQRTLETAAERTWLISILRHKIVDHLRKASRERALTQPAEIASSSESYDRRGHWSEMPGRWSADASKLVEQAEFRAALHRCVQGLPPRAAEVFALREMEQMSADAVCEVLGISPANLWTQLHRARLALRRCLEKNWFST